MCARFVVGIAAANYAPAGAYLSYATSIEDRTRIMAWNSAATVLGFICGPTFSLITSLPQLQFQIKIRNFTINVNEYTSPGWISALFGLLGLLSMIPFQDIKRKTSFDTHVEKMKSTSMRSFRSLFSLGETSFGLKGVVLCLWMQFAFTTAFTLFETVGPLYTARAFNWTVWKTSIMFMGISVLSLVALILLQVFLKFFNERHMLVICSLLLNIGLMIFVDWNNQYLNLIRFGIGIFFISVGYACGAALLLAVFTKVLKENEQGVMLGWLSSVGSIARMTIPIISSYFWLYLGPNYLFLCVTMLMFISTFCSVVFYHYLLPRADQEISSFPPTAVN
eukprot:TRINITY_DN2227_c0_g1_i3.p1 TRINITY_DN2227_c0_g1~~TRINITY_DN2227_c0_g1_i3.p1  ORF type:complete len:336 (-),score=40.19 TRINITY_DN2227_c0_g1_i3:186-1193(-)